MDIFSERDITYTFHLPSTAEDCLGKGGEGEVKDVLYPEGKISQENVELIALVKIPKRVRNKTPSAHKQLLLVR